MTSTQRQQQFIHKVLQACDHCQPLQPKKHTGMGCAPVNIALSKYWGKRDTDLNLPINGSVSISLPGLGTKTEISIIESDSDEIYLNNKSLPAGDKFALRLSHYLDGFRQDNKTRFCVKTTNTVPTAAGLASSASGYAALVLALNDLFDWQLSTQNLSLLARLGSGSASRSIYNGFAIWHKGKQDNGLDSFAEPIETQWPELSIGLVKIDTQEKSIGSTAGMQQTVETCELYQSWPKQASQDMKIISQAIKGHDFETLGKTAEHNALTMHATMIATWPPIVYWQPPSVQAMQLVWQLRAQGIAVYFTMDAGPNLKLILQQNNESPVAQAFAKISMPIEFIRPFELT